jgi:hypothetical protein
MQEDHVRLRTGTEKTHFDDLGVYGRVKRKVKLSLCLII